MTYNMKDIEYINFNKIYNWEYYMGFAYDMITDKLIERSMDFNLKNINIDDHWYHQEFFNDLNKSKRDVIKMHAYRIAALATIIKNNSNEIITPIDFDSIRWNNGCSGVQDGNHRIRAFQFLKYKSFPANCSGEESEIFKIIDLD